MMPVFADTSALYAMAVPTDSNHEQVKAWLASNKPRLIVTDYVIDEFLTLLQFRSEKRRAIEFGEELLQGKLAIIEWVTPVDFQKGWRTFREFNDKNWSFTDCVSYVVMLRLGIMQAVAFDEHFRQFGTVSVLP